MQAGGGGVASSSEDHLTASHFRLTNFLGHGDYGVVYGAIHVPTGRPVACKFFGYEGMREPQLPWIQREVRELEQLLGINGVAQLFGTFDDAPQGLLTGQQARSIGGPQRVLRKLRPISYPVIVMERATGCDLITRLMQRGKFS